MTYRYIFRAPVLAIFEVTHDDARQGHEQLTAALDDGLLAHTHTTADVNDDTTAAGGIVIRALATHPGFRPTLHGVHNPGPTDPSPADTPADAGDIAVPVTPETELRRAFADYTDATNHYADLKEQAETDGNTDAADHYADTTLADLRDTYIGAMENMLHHLGIDPAEPDAPPLIGNLPYRWFEIADPADNHRFRFQLPDPADITAHCEDSDRCQFTLTAYHQH